jgi:hypothetical protein
MKRLFLVCVLLAAIPLHALGAEPSGGNVTGGLPEHHAEDPSAAAVTEQNLLTSERFWPYQVAATEALPAVAGRQPVPAGNVGVLIRVEASGAARIDFGRDGLHEVPIAKTDLVERANRIRTGELAKLAPNFLLAIGPRLVDSAGDALRPLPYASVAEQRGFLCVFADPGAKKFAALAAALAPLQQRHGVATILLPQGEHPDARVREQLRSLGWTIPFVYDHLAEAYTRSLLDADVALPAVVLQTREGRVLFQSEWKAGVASTLEAALDAAFASAPPPTAASPDVVRE